MIYSMAMLLVIQYQMCCRFTSRASETRLSISRTRRLLFQRIAVVFLRESDCSYITRTWNCNWFLPETIRSPVWKRNKWESEKRIDIQLIDYPEYNSFFTSLFVNYMLVSLREFTWKLLVIIRMITSLSIPSFFISWMHRQTESLSCS